MWSVFFVFLSYLDRNFVKGEFLSNSLDAEKESKEISYMLNNTFCAKISVVGEYHLHQVSDGIEEVRSVHDPTGKLVDCSVTANDIQIKSFMHVCRLGLRDHRKKPEGLELTTTNVAEAKSKCKELKSKEREGLTVPTQRPQERNPITGAHNENRILRRSKRGFTYPGTLWCGAGNIAENYDQLGEFAETDKCCRVHDHCPYVIHAFSSKYGYTNFRWHSICHCDCDNTLKTCLRKVNDTSSRVVGQAFFNVIEVPCFEFSYEEQCVERHWYGMCKRYDRVPVAVIQESVPYDFGGINVIDELTLPPPANKLSDSDTEQEKRESTTQSTVSGSQSTNPQEPSLRNVVTAAEDFIKVLATVSTSQSSSTETAKGDKGETQSSEKKRKKNSGKKKKEEKRKRGKGKGRKRKDKINKVSKTEDGLAGAPQSSRPEETVGQNNFVDDPGKIDQLLTNVDNFMNGKFDAGEVKEFSNIVMRDEPQRLLENSQSSTASPLHIKGSQVQESKKQENHTDTAPLSPTVLTPSTIYDRSKGSRERKGKRQRHFIPTIPLVEETQHSISDDSVTPTITADSVGITAVTIVSNTDTGVREETRRSENLSEKGSVLIAATPSAPIVNLLKPKRQRSKERAGRKRMRKVTAPAMGEGELNQDTAAVELHLITSGSAGEPTVLTTSEPVSSDRLQPHASGNHTVERLWSLTTSPPALTVKKPQRSKKSREGKRMRRVKPSPTNNAIVSTTGSEAITTSTISTTTISTEVEVDAPGELQSKNTDVTTVQPTLTAQTSTSSVLLPSKGRPKRRKSKERKGKEKRQKTKAAYSPI